MFFRAALDLKSTLTLLFLGRMTPRVSMLFPYVSQARMEYAKYEMEADGLSCSLLEVASTLHELAPQLGSRFLGRVPPSAGLLTHSGVGPELLKSP